MKNMTKSNFYASCVALAVFCVMGLPGCASTAPAAGALLESSIILPPSGAFLPPWITHPTSEYASPEPVVVISDPNLDRFTPNSNSTWNRAHRVEIQGRGLQPVALGAILRVLTAASELTLSGVTVGSSHIEMLSNIRSLKRLGFVSCTFETNCRLDALGNLPELEEMSLVCCNQEGGDLNKSRFPRLRELKYLTLETQIAFETIEALLTGPRLSFVAISQGCGIVSQVRRVFDERPSSTIVFVQNP